MLRELDAPEAQCRERLGARLGDAPAAAAETTAAGG
jgi:hypothetical protein